ncbi:MAG: anti-sigma factor [Dehalococcoidia bacterium]
MKRARSSGAQWWIAAGFALLLMLAPLTSNAARANGVPTIILLSYIEGLSTWGPQDATGEVEISFSAGYARVTVNGLPALGDERDYQGWLVNSDSNAAITIGRFDADEDAVISFDGTLPPVDDFGFDLFLITVEPDPDSGLQPTSDRAIGGYFSLVGPIETDPGSATDTAADGTAQQQGQQQDQPPQQQPAELPSTGDPALKTDIARISLLGAAVVASLFFGLRFARSNGARREQ